MADVGKVTEVAEEGIRFGEAQPPEVQGVDAGTRRCVGNDVWPRLYQHGGQSHRVEVRSSAKHVPNKADEMGYAAPASIDPDRAYKLGKVAALAQNLSELLEHIFIVAVSDPVVRNINEDRAEKALLCNACPPTANERARFECNKVMGQLVEDGTLDVVGKRERASRVTIGELGHEEVRS